MAMRSLETVDVRVGRSNENARKVAEFLAAGLDLLLRCQGQRDGSLRAVGHLQIMKLAVSLGGTETLISHPASMTHSGIARELREEIGLTDALIRISAGIENAEDLVSDMAQGLEYV